MPMQSWKSGQCDALLRKQADSGYTNHADQVKADNYLRGYFRGTEQLNEISKTTKIVVMLPPRGGQHVG